MSQQAPLRGGLHATALWLNFPIVSIPTMQRTRTWTCAGLNWWLAIALYLPSLGAVLGLPLEYQPAPADNPLKGFVSYPGATGDFPHSMEWGYFSMRDVVVGNGQYDWSPLENQLRNSALKGYQFCCRFYMEWPGKPVAIPKYLLEEGVSAYSWTNTNTQPFPPAVNLTPDYEDVRLRKAVQDFIAEFGHRYDGDPRLAFVSLGILGSWGEWHNHPSNFLFASKTVQAEVYEAYEKAFPTTRLLARYPAGEKDPIYAPNNLRAVGYHDDSFGWATVHTGRKQDEWFFESRLRRAGVLDKWRSQPIGGEVRPEVWDCLFADPSCAPPGQDYERCLSATHASWLANHGLFHKTLDAETRARAIQAAQKLGYELHVTDATLRTSDLAPELLLSLSLTNTGVAPFYYNWPVELGACTRFGQRLLHIWPTEWQPTEIQPEQPATRWAKRLGLQDLPEGDYKLLLRIRNPMPGGRPVRFANTTQDKDVQGWLSVGEFRASRPQVPDQPKEDRSQGLRLQVNLIRLHPDAVLDEGLQDWLDSVTRQSRAASYPIESLTAGRRSALPQGMLFDRIIGPGLLDIGNPAEAASLMDALRREPGIEILSLPAKSAQVGNTLEFHFSQKTPVHTAILDQAMVSPGNSSPYQGNPFAVTQVDCGVWFSLDSSWQRNQSTIQGRIQFTTVDFDGYRVDPTRDPVEIWFHGERRWMDIPLPLLYAREIQSSVTFSPGTSLLLGSWAAAPESSPQGREPVSESLIPGVDPTIPPLLILITTELVTPPAQP